MPSPRKSKSSISLTSEERYKMHSSAKSCESIYSNASSKASAAVVYSRSKLQNPSVVRRQSSLIPATAEVRQRVLSARRLKIKNFQNQLADAKQTIEDLLHENRMLQTLHKRQDSALAKYESSNAELPQLLNAHSEELRMWQTKCKNVQSINKEMEHKLKQKEALIMSLTDQNKHLSQLNKDKNLLERQQLREENDDLRTQLKAKETELNVLMRKYQLEIKNMKQQLQNEQKRTKNALVELENCRIEVSAYNKIDQMNLSNNAVPRRPTRVNKPSDKLEKILENPLEANLEALQFAVANDKLDEAKKAKKKDTFPTEIAPPTATVRFAKREVGGDATVATIKKIPKPKVPKKETPRTVMPAKLTAVAKEKLEDKPKALNTILDVDSENDLLSVNDDYLADDQIDTADEVSIRDESEMKIDEEEFKAIRMRSDISSIRKKILGEDYDKREQFIDGFCLQNNSALGNDADEDEKEDKYRQLSKNAAFPLDAN